MNTKVDECKLISGKDALIALANGESVEYMDTSDAFGSLGWGNAFGLGTNLFFLDRFKFRLKPPTIRLSLEIPAPFEPKTNQKYFYLYTENMSGYGNDYYEENLITKMRVQFGAWRTEGEIKQVVAALRQIFGDSHD